MSLSLHHIWSMYLDTWMRTRKNWWNTLKQNLAGVEVMLTPQCQNFRWRSVMNVGMQPRCLSQSCCYERKQWKISLRVLDICAMETIDHRADQQVSIYQQSSSHEPPIRQLYTTSSSSICSTTSRLGPSDLGVHWFLHLWHTFQTPLPTSSGTAF